MHVEKLKWEHLRDLDVQDRHHANWKWLVEREEYKEWAGATDAWSLLSDGKPLACGGIHDHIAWAFIGKDIGGAGLLKATRAVTKFLDKHEYVYADSDKSFENGERWLHILGFEPIGDGQWLRTN